MSFLLTRMFAYFTLVMYLVVGSVAVRVLAPEMTTIEISSSYFKLFSNTELNATEALQVEVPELAFNEIQFPVEKVIVAKAKPRALTKKAPVQVTKAPAMKYETVAKNELPFYEPVRLEAVYMNTELPQNLASLYTEFKYEMVAEVKKEEVVQDEVSTSLAANAEPEFFEYDTTPVASTEAAPVQEELPTSPQIVNNVEDVQNVDKAHEEEIAVNDLIAFDYSKAKTDLKEQTMPVISTVTTQVPAAVTNTPVVQNSSKTRKPKLLVDNKIITQDPIVDNNEKNGFMAEESTIYPNRVTIQITGTDFKTTQKEVGFEIRFQDDLSEAIQDYNGGAITLDQNLSGPRMSRTISILKRGFVPTNTDLILEEGVAEVTLPMIEEDTFNTLMEPFEARGPIGAVLVELDQDTEDATLDVPFSKVLKLDADMRVTNEGEYTYLAFIGVKSGNALLTYKNVTNESVSKIIHIHEREVTFESSILEAVEDEKVKLVEEDLLSKEKLPLIISSEEVKQFATSKTAKKLNNHTYKMDFRSTVLGARKYLELNHQSEPVFIGFKDNAKIEVPSENFMRFILSRFEGANLGNRCLVQVNLKKKAVKFEVGTESIQASLMTSAQVLDTDGKFYESIGEKSTKIIIVGEHQGAPELGQDGKINVKITYQDGSEQYLGSYCSPNTYLVEQL